MSEFYITKQEDVYNSILRRGVEVTISRSGSNSVDLETGELISTGGGSTYSSYALVLDTKTEGMDGKKPSMENTSIDKTVSKLMVANWNPTTGSELAITIEPGDNLTFNGLEHEVVEVMPFQIGGITVYYDMKVAK